MRKIAALFMCAALAGTIAFTAGCGRANLFSWAHSEGGSSDIRSLGADAQTAMQNKNFAKAAEYYQKILDQDPGNSEAIYGYCAAVMADSGLDVAALVSSMVAQQAPAHVTGLSSSVLAIGRSAPGGYPLLPQTIIDRAEYFRDVLNKVLAQDKLARIIKAKADSKIDPENPDVNLNAAFCLILRAALAAEVEGHITFNNDYTVTVSPGFNNAVATQIGKDVASAYQRFKKVALKLNLTDSSTISKVESDAEKVFNDYNTKTGLALNLNYDYFLNE